MRHCLLKGSAATEHAVEQNRISGKKQILPFDLKLK
jgi:hypothetical protein